MQKQDMKTNNRIFSIFLTIVFIALYYVTFSFPVKAAIYPRGLLIVGILCSIALFISTYISKKVEEKKVIIGKEEMKRLLLSIVWMIIYAIIIPLLGYSVSTFIYMLVQMWILKPDGKKKLYFLIALISTGILYVGFGMFLSVWLPKGLFF